MTIKAFAVSNRIDLDKGCKYEILVFCKDAHSAMSYGSDIMSRVSGKSYKYADALTKRVPEMDNIPNTGSNEWYAESNDDLPIGSRY